MQTATKQARELNKQSVMGHVLTIAVLVFLFFDCGIKVLSLAPAVQGTVELGYPEQMVRVIGYIQLACIVLYAFPRTSVLGALLLTGYLGGAVATHVRLENPLFSHILFPVYVALFVWGGLYLRDSRLRQLVPLRRQAN